jgi:tRNA dimethylallyltransferase
MKMNDMVKNKINLIAIIGTTASGKTKLAVQLAKDMSSEIISADSRQVYRGLDIGTGKDLKDYSIEGVTIPVHLIDIVDPEVEFSLFDYQKRFYQCFQDIFSRGIMPIMVGGSGLYIESIIMNYRLAKVPENSALRKELGKMDMNSLIQRLLAINPSVHNTTDLRDRERALRAIEIAEYLKDFRASHDESSMWSLIAPLVVGIRLPRHILRNSIKNRLKRRFSEGMVDEVKKLHDRGIKWERLDLLGLEYRYVSRYLQGQITSDEMFQELYAKICQFAKRQETWFRRMEKRGISIHWIDGEDYSSLKKLCYAYMP